MAADAFFSNDGDEDTTVDAHITMSDQPAETPEQVTRVAANRLRHAARDQAFESNDEPEAIETPNAEPQVPRRVGRKPAA